MKKKTIEINTAEIKLDFDKLTRKFKVKQWFEKAGARCSSYSYVTFSIAFSLRPLCPLRFRWFHPACLELVERSLRLPASVSVVKFSA